MKTIEIQPAQAGMSEAKKSEIKGLIYLQHGMGC